MSSTGVFGTPPSGVNLSETQNSSITSAVVALMVIGTIAVVLRVIARTMQRGIGLALDDYLVILGLVFAHGTATCCLVSLKYGGGKHLWVLTAQEFTTIWQILFAYVMIYATAVSFTKCSIVMFYRRIFGITWSLWICLFLVWSYWFTIIVTICTSCQPLEYFWTQYTTVGAEGHCIDVPLFFFANGIWAMLVDVIILCVPVPIVYGLNMPKKQKSAVVGILLLGSFVCIASIVRIISIHTLMNETDLTWAMAGVFIWSCCEPFIGIVCACLPTLAPLLRRWWTQKRGSGRNGSTGTPLPSGARSGFNNGSKQLSDFSIVDNTPGGGAGGFRKDKREWKRLHEQPKLRNDDEVELTNEISGPDASFRTKTSDEEGSGSGDFAMTDIHVKKDVSWVSAQMVDDDYREKSGGRYS